MSYLTNLFLQVSLQLLKLSIKMHLHLLALMRSLVHFGLLMHLCLDLLNFAVEFLKFLPEILLSQPVLAQECRCCLLLDLCL